MAEPKEVSLNCFEFDGRVRIEPARVKKTAVATEELLAQLAGRYAAGRPDADGKRIQIGSEMSYIDPAAPKVWRVYKLEKVVETMPDGREATVERFLPVADETDRALAERRATALLKG